MGGWRCNETSIPRLQAGLSHFKTLVLPHQAGQVPHRRTQAGGGRRRRPAALEAGRVHGRGQLHQHEQHEQHEQQHRHPDGPAAALGAAGHRGQTGEGVMH